MNKRNSIILGVVVLLLVGVIGSRFLMGMTAVSPSQSPVMTTGKAKTYTFTEIQSHNDSKSCWTTIDGNVYDVTSFVSAHPGGAENLLSLCGIDGSSAFSAQHGNNREAKEQLASLLIGTLSSK